VRPTKPRPAAAATTATAAAAAASESVAATCGAQLQHIIGSIGAELPPTAAGILNGVIRRQPRFPSL